MNHRRPVLGGVLAVVVLALLLFVTTSQTRMPGEESAAFDMKEASAFVANPTGRPTYLQGQRAACRTEPNPEVKVYPELKSETPYYGTIIIDRDYRDPESGIEFHFVIDESGEAPEDASEEAPVEEQSGSWLKTLSNALFGKPERPAAAEVKQNAITYDRLYFDANHDLDLTNDPVLGPMKNPPPGAMSPYSVEQNVVYDFLSVWLDRSPDLGADPVRVVPRFEVTERKGVKHAQVDFVAASVRKGRIRLGSREYDAVLRQEYVVSGRFDRPFTSLSLTAVGGNWSWSSSGPASEDLNTMRCLNGKYYTTSATPAGDKLFVKRYDGEMGEFRVGPGSRDIRGFGFSGELRAEGRTVLVGERLTVGTESPESYSLPVGDYYPDYSSIRFGRLRMNLSNNYHVDGGRRQRMSQTPVYCFKIRKDKPCVLDFSAEPEVLFASPAKDATFAPGDEIEVKAVLVDTKLDVMIRGLYDTDSGRLSLLDPTVTITDSSGKEVGTGKLPFG